MLRMLASLVFGKAEPQRFALAELTETARDQIGSWMTPQAPDSEKTVNTQNLVTTLSAEQRDYRAKTDRPRQGLMRLGTTYEQTSFLSRTRGPDGRLCLQLGETITPAGSRPLTQTALEMQLQVSGPDLVLEQCRLGGRTFRPDLRQLKRLFQVTESFRISLLQGKTFRPVQELRHFHEDHGGLAAQARQGHDHLLNPPPSVPVSAPHQGHHPA